MKVRLISDNLHQNKSFEVWDGTNPLGWYAINTKRRENLWQIVSDSQLYSARSLVLQGNTTNALNYIDVVKGATVRSDGPGLFYNVSTIPHDLTTNFVTHEDITTALDLNSIGLDRLYDADIVNEVMEIKDITTFLSMETEMLRFPEYSDSKSFSTIIVQEKNSKRLEISQKYNPVRTTLSFLNCLKENEAIRTFFYTCSVYGVGFSVEVWEEQTSGGNWGNVKWGNSKWGGFDSGYGYGKKYHFNIANNNFSESSTNGKLDVNVILQKRDLDYVN